MIGLDGPETTRCSRAGCAAEATSAVHWRNPRIHDVDRVKTWLACDEHTDYLREYLSSRAFPVSVTAVGQSVERV